MSYTKYSVIHILGLGDMFSPQVWENGFLICLFGSIRWMCCFVGVTSQYYAFIFFPQMVKHFDDYGYRSSCLKNLLNVFVFKSIALMLVGFIFFLLCTKMVYKLSVCCTQTRNTKCWKFRGSLGHDPVITPSCEGSNPMVSWKVVAYFIVLWKIVRFLLCMMNGSITWSISAIVNYFYAFRLNGAVTLTNYFRWFM